MSTHFYSPDEDIIKEESINNYKHIFKDYYKNYPTLREALEQLYLNCGATKEKANSLIDDIIARAEKRVNEDKKIDIEKNYPNLTLEEKETISSYTYEAEEKQYNLYRILNTNLVKDNREEGIKNVSKYFFILLNALRKLPKYYPNDKFKFLYRSIKNSVKLNYDLFNKKIVPYIVGKQKTFWAFTSTSPDSSETLSFLGTNQLYPDLKAGTIFTLSGKVWGYDISLFNVCNEVEVLLEPERKLMVEEIMDLNGIIHITCNILDTPIVLKNENEIIMKIKIEKDDIKKDIYFLDNSGDHDNLKELNELNVELFIDDIKYKYQKYFNPEKEGIYTIKILFKLKMKDCSNMFYKCKNLIDINLSSFDTEEVFSMSEMFFGCNKLISLDLSSLNTKNVEYMGAMFMYCTSLSNLNISTFNTEKVVDIHNMFLGCSNLTELNLSSFNLKKVTGNITGIFCDCSKLKSIDFSNVEIEHFNSLRRKSRGVLPYSDNFEIRFKNGKKIGGIF